MNQVCPAGLIVSFFCFFEWFNSRKKFGQFLSKGGTLTKKKLEIFVVTMYDNSYTNRKPLNEHLSKKFAGRAD